MIGWFWAMGTATNDPAPQVKKRQCSQCFHIRQCWRVEQQHSRADDASVRDEWWCAECIAKVAQRRQ